MHASDIIVAVTSDSSPPVRGRTRYFSKTGCVVEYPERRDVFVGGSLIGMFTPEDRPMRNTLLVAAARSEGAVLGKLAEAFGVSVGTLFSVRRRFERGGLQAIVKSGGKPRKLTPKLVEQLSKLFEQGLTIDEAHKRIRKRVSRTIVGRAHKQWADAKKSQQQREQREHEDKTRQQTLDVFVTVKKAERRVRRKPAEPTDPKDGEAETDEEIGLVRATACGGTHVQHLGSWIMLAMLGALGLYAYAEYLRADAARKLADKGKRFIAAAALRVALDAVALSLVLGEGCVEGVRRIATPSAPTLLRHRRAITPSWARRVLGYFSDAAGDLLHMVQATVLVQHSEQHADERVVFYVDNHMRPYTGKNTVRKGWRMRDKRAVAGATDYWVHDAQGRPVFRVHSPEHDSLASWLQPIGDKLREALHDKDRRVVLVFDRAGAGAETMTQLRDAGFDFVTYEKKPYPKLAACAFDHWIEIDDKRYEYTEVNRKNLRKGRGRVRRIAMRSAEGEQFNIVAASEAPAVDIITWMLARWARQENQFKHGAERWGFNQLDGRRTEEYPPDAIIPNPARRRVERELQDARKTEGEALRKLSRLELDDPKRDKLEGDIDRARAAQDNLEALRPYVPTHAAVEDTELAGELVKHRRSYKLLIDTLRIGLANAESELAARLAPRLVRGKEAKKTLKNLFVAPGSVRVNKRSVTITLSPAGTPRELEAFAGLLAELNDLPLTLPGDAEGRRLRFGLTKT